MLFQKEKKILILGAGPSGMGCASVLADKGIPSRVIDRESDAGGLCRTVNFHDYLFDIGGHRFLSKCPEVNLFWEKVMGDKMLRVKRLSRIFYKKRFFNYPLSFFNTFWNFGPLESFLCVASYLRCRVFRPGDEQTFEGWITNRFGRRLYEIFFKTYTEKVWAVPCRDISANWAKQRIQGLSLKVAIQKALTGLRTNLPKTLAQQFLYPEKGPGDFYRRLRERIEPGGVSFLMEKEVVRVRHHNRRIVSVDVRDGRNPGVLESLPADYLFSSLPLPGLIRRLDPPPPANILQKASRLKFRNFLVINIILDKPFVFPDQWIYVHSPEVSLGRIQNYKNWSPSMVVDQGKTSLGLEYFCNENDWLWKKNDVDLIQFALTELERLRIVSRRHLIDGFVVRQSDVYPVYELGYEAIVRELREYLEGFSNIQTIGRAGLFRYDNSDHALLTGISAARNFTGEARTDLWKLNTDDSYLES